LRIREKSDPNGWQHLQSAICNLQSAICNLQFTHALRDRRRVNIRSYLDMITSHR
jgi:hypothetical protein